MVKLTDEIVHQCIGLINSTENQTKLRKTLVDPILSYISSKVFPYFASLTVLLIVNILLLLIIIYLLVVRPGNPFHTIV